MFIAIPVERIPYARCRCWFLPHLPFRSPFLPLNTFLLATAFSEHPSSPFFWRCIWTGSAIVWSTQWTVQPFLLLASHTWMSSLYNRVTKIRWDKLSASHVLRKCSQGRCRRWESAGKRRGHKGNKKDELFDSSCVFPGQAKQWRNITAEMFDDRRGTEGQAKCQSSLYTVQSHPVRDHVVAGHRLHWSQWQCGGGDRM